MGPMVEYSSDPETVVVTCQDKVLVVHVGSDTWSWKTGSACPRARNRGGRIVRPSGPNPPPPFRVLSIYDVVFGFSGLCYARQLPEATS